MAEGTGGFWDQARKARAAIENRVKGVNETKPVGPGEQIMVESGKSIIVGRNPIEVDNKATIEGDRKTINMDKQNMSTN